jgi:hypothetical protein
MSVGRVYVALNVFAFMLGSASVVAQTRYSGATDAQILAACPGFKSASEIRLLPLNPDLNYQAFLARTGFNDDRFVGPRGDGCWCSYDRRDVKGAVCRPMKKAW